MYDAGSSTRQLLSHICANHMLLGCCSSSAFDKEHSQGGRCIELGAGATGLPGIVAAQLGCFSQVSQSCLSLLCSCCPQQTLLLMYLQLAFHQSSAQSAAFKVPHHVPQVVITDVDECLEALHENVAANLSPHCTLAPSCLSQAPATEASSLQLGSLPEAEAASASASASHNTSASSMSMYSVNRDCSAGEPAKNLHEASTADASRCNPQLRDPQNASQQEALPQAARHPVSKTSRTELNKQSAEQQTEVLVAELDWGQEASSVAPPFDVVLIADVVSTVT